MVSFTRSLLALPLLVALALATHPDTVTITQISKVYETKTITETSCYTTTVHGKPTTITKYDIKTEVYTSYCTEYITSKETVYKPTTEYATETVVKPTTVYVKKYDISTIYQPTTCYVTVTYTTTDYNNVVKTVVTTVVVPTTIYKHKYKTVTLPAEIKTITEVKDNTKYIYQTEYITVSKILQTTPPTYTTPAYPTIAPNSTYIPPPIATGGAPRLTTASGAIVAVLFSLYALF
jgi:hypothetical protein